MEKNPTVSTKLHNFDLSKKGNMIKPRIKVYQSSSSAKWIQRAIATTGFIALMYNVVIVPQKKSHEVATPEDRRLSISYGDGTCKWQPPAYDVPEDIDFWKTMVVGYPSGDKRLTFVQMEALTGWPAKDEWDFKHLGMSNHPFIKANYPHHEGKLMERGHFLFISSSLTTLHHRLHVIANARSLHT